MRILQQIYPQILAKNLGKIIFADKTITDEQRAAAVRAKVFIVNKNDLLKTEEISGEQHALVMHTMPFVTKQGARQIMHVHALNSEGEVRQYYDEEIVLPAGMGDQATIVISAEYFVRKPEKAKEDITKLVAEMLDEGKHGKKKVFISEEDVDASGYRDYAKDGREENKTGETAEDKEQELPLSERLAQIKLGSFRQLWNDKDKRETLRDGLAKIGAETPYNKDVIRKRMGQFKEFYRIEDSGISAFMPDFLIDFFGMKDNGFDHFIKKLTERVGIIERDGKDIQNKNDMIDDLKTGKANERSSLDNGRFTTESFWQYYERQADDYLARFKGTPLTGDMLARASERVYQETGILVPVELALAQAQQETSMGTKGRNPRTNPFNIGAIDNGATLWHFGSTYEGVLAYYQLIVDDYLNGKSLGGLLENFVNKEGSRYATDPGYERKLKSIMAGMQESSGRRNQAVYARTAVGTQREGKDIQEKAVPPVLSDPGKLNEYLINEGVLRGNDNHGAGQYGAARNGTAQGSGGEREHKGIDIRAEVGSKVHIPFGGKVIAAQEQGDYGNVVKVVTRAAGQPNLIEVYAHLSEILVKEGEELKAGDVIGLSGKSGNANQEGITPHVHFELRINDQVVDPTKVFAEAYLRVKAYENDGFIAPDSRLKGLAALANIRLADVFDEFIDPIAQAKEDPVPAITETLEERIARLQKHYDGTVVPVFDIIIARLSSVGSDMALLLRDEAGRVVLMDKQGTTRPADEELQQEFLSAFEEHGLKGSGLQRGVVFVFSPQGWQQSEKHILDMVGAFLRTLDGKDQDHKFLVLKKFKPVQDFERKPVRAEPADKDKESYDVKRFFDSILKRELKEETQEGRHAAQIREDLAMDQIREGKEDVKRKIQELQREILKSELKTTEENNAIKEFLASQQEGKGVIRSIWEGVKKWYRGYFDAEALKLEKEVARMKEDKAGLKEALAVLRKVNKVEDNEALKAAEEIINQEMAILTAEINSRELKLKALQGEDSDDDTSAIDQRIADLLGQGKIEEANRLAESKERDGKSDAVLRWIAQESYKIDIQMAKLRLGQIDGKELEKETAAYLGTIKIIDRMNEGIRQAYNIIRRMRSRP